MPGNPVVGLAVGKSVVRLQEVVRPGPGVLLRAVSTAICLEARQRYQVVDVDISAGVVWGVVAHLRGTDICRAPADMSTSTT